MKERKRLFILERIYFGWWEPIGIYMTQKVASAERYDLVKWHSVPKDNLRITPWVRER